MTYAGTVIENFFTLVVCVVAAACLAFVLFLAWRQFGPKRRHRRHRSRTRRYLGKH